MHIPALFTLLAATALALPTPQAYLSGIPGNFIAPNRFYSPGCLGGQICNSWNWYHELKNGKPLTPNGKPLTGESAATEPNAQSPAVEQSLTTRQENIEDKAGVFSCKHTNWSGSCTYHQTPLGSAPSSCTLLSPETSSIGPDKGFYCIFYTNALCAPLASDGSDTLPLTYPGAGNLGVTDKGDFNDRLLSYQCFREDEYTLDPLESSDADAFEMAKAKVLAQGV